MATLEVKTDSKTLLRVDDSMNVLVSSMDIDRATVLRMLLKAMATFSNIDLDIRPGTSLASPQNDNR